MDGKSLFYTTKKKCGSTACENYHSKMVEKIEKNIIALFDTSALMNKIFPCSAGLSVSTHLQYIDSNGIIRILPRESESWETLDVVNFRVLKARSPLDYFPPFETPLEPVIKIYDKHIVKPCLEPRYDRKIIKRR